MARNDGVGGCGVRWSGLRQGARGETGDLPGRLRQREDRPHHTLRVVGSKRLSTWPAGSKLLSFTFTACQEAGKADISWMAGGARHRISLLARPTRFTVVPAS